MKEKLNLNVLKKKEVMTQGGPASNEDNLLKGLNEIRNKNTEDAINYLTNYQYSTLLKDLIAFHRYISAKKQPFENTYICVETNSEAESNPVEDAIDTILISSINKVADSRKEKLMNLDFDSLVSTDNLKTILENCFQDVFVIGNIKETKQFEKESNKIINFVKNLVRNNIVMILGSKKDIEDTLNELDNPQHFYFDISQPFSVSQIGYHLKKILQNNGFIFEKDWINALAVYLDQPAQSKKKKNFDYVLDLVNYLERKALTDKNQQKKGNQVIILKEYFLAEKVDFKVSELTSLKALDKLVGMEEAKRRVRELIAYLEFTQKMQMKTGKQFPLNLHMMFTGAPGTGKTTIARIIANVLFELGYIRKEEIVEVDKKDLVSQWVGHTSTKTYEVIESAMGGVLFIDEAYSIVDDKYGADAIATLIKAMEDYKTDLVVIVAGYEKEMQDFIDANPGMKSRIGQKIHFKDYSAEELVQIYNVKMKDYQMATSPEAYEELKEALDKGLQVKNFGNGRFVDNLIQDIFLSFAVQTQGIPAESLEFKITPDHIPAKYLN